MKLTIIGSGNVATHLAKASVAAGHEIVQIWSRKKEHAQLLTQLVGGDAIEDLEQLNPDVDCILLAIPDDAICSLSKQLRVEETLVAHTSGSVPLSVLKDIGPLHGVIYIPQTFVRNVEMEYSQLPFCIEGSSVEVTEKLEILAKSISPNVYHIDSDRRQWLHLASVMVNNFGNALNALASQILGQHQIPFSTIQPLIEATADKSRLSVQQGINLWQLQTGPAVRNDEETIARHQELLKNEDSVLKLYNLMTDLIRQQFPLHEKA